MARTKTSITVDADLLDEARAMGINLSAAAETGLRNIVETERRARLKEELRPTVEAFNRWIDANGVPFADRRAFWPRKTD